jgi:hypothetical protein
MGVVRLLGWSANDQPVYPLAGCPSHNLPPTCYRPELKGPTTAGMEGDHPMSWQTGSLPKARRELLRCRVQIDVGTHIAWLRDKTCDRLQKMVSNMYAWRRMGLPREDFSLTVTPQVGTKG